MTPTAQEKRATPRDPGFTLPATPDEVLRHAQQQSDFVAKLRRTYGHLLDRYELGEAALLLKTEAIWERIPENHGLDWAAYLRKLTGKDYCLAAIDRHMRLPRFFTREQVLAYGERGLSFTILAEITYAHEKLREPLLQSALAGASVAAIVKGRAAGNRVLRGPQKGRKKGVDKGSVVEALNALHKALAGQLQDEEDEQELMAICPHCGAPAEGHEAGPVPQPEEVIRWRAELAGKETELNQKAQELAGREERLRLREEVVAVAGGQPVEQAVEQRFQQLQADRAQLEQERAALVQKQKEVAAWQVEQDQQARSLATAADDLKTAQVLLAEVQRREEAVAGLEQRAAVLEAREQEVARRELCANVREEELLGREESLALLAQETEHKRAELAQAHELILQRNFEVEKKARDNCLIVWTEQPYCIDSNLNIMADTLYRVRDLAQRGQEQLQEEGQVPHKGGLELIIDTSRALKAVTRELKPLLEQAVGDYCARYPDKAQSFWERHQHDRDDEDDDDDGGEGSSPPGGTGGGGLSVLRPSAPIAAQTGAPAADDEVVRPQVLLGAGNADSPQFGHLATEVRHGTSVGIDLNLIQCVILYGLQNFGKSVSIQVLIEMLTSNIPLISRVKKPLGVIYCHYDSGQGYPPSIARALGANIDPNNIAWLRKTFGIRVKPRGLPRLLVLVPPNLSQEQMEQRRRDYPGAEIRVLGLSMHDLRSRGLRLIMAATDNSALYMARLEQILAKLGDNFTLEDLEARILEAGFRPRELELIEERLSLVRDYVTSQSSISELFHEGDTIVLDLRHDFLKKDTAMALFTVLIEAFQKSRARDGEEFNKVVVFDESHKYLRRDSPIAEQVVDAIKEMRHRQMWIVLATQDPLGVPREVNALNTITIVHKLTDRDMLRELRKRNPAWDKVTIEMLQSLETGEAYVLALVATEAGWTVEPRKVRIRPPCSQPGGSTRSAVSAA